MHKTHNIYGNQDKSSTTIRKPTQQVQKIGDKQYKQAMRHMNKINKYQQQIEAKKNQQQPLDKQCTFRPTLFTKNYKVKKDRDSHNPEKNMLNWYRKRNDKLLQQTVNRSVQLQKQTRSIIQTSSLQKINHNKKYYQTIKKKQKGTLQNTISKNQSFATTLHPKYLGHYTKQAMKSGNLSTLCPSCKNSTFNLKSSDSLLNNI